MKMILWLVIIPISIVFIIRIYVCRCYRKRKMLTNDIPTNGDNHFNKGDKCFLFSHFPLDYSLFDKLPLKICRGVSIVGTPHHALCKAAGKNADENENLALASYVYPEYALKCGSVHACIKIDKDIPDDQKDRLFWLMVGALAIVKPIFIDISGAFVYGDQDGFICKPERLNYRSNLSLDAIKQQCNLDHNFFRYNLHDFELVKIIFPKLLNIFRLRESSPRPFFNLMMFFQLALWEKLNYESTLFSKLFPLVDSFAGNPSYRQNEKVSSRLANFLSDVPYQLDQKQLSNEKIKNRLKYIWEIHRYPELHGHLKLPSSQSMSNQVQSNFNFTKDLFDLFEISRLCIYKMLLLSESDFESYSKISIPLLGVSVGDAKESNKKRDEEADLFFDKTYNNAPELINLINFSTTTLK